VSSSRLSAARRRGRSRRAQQPAMPVIGFLNQTTADAYPDAMAGFHAGLRETGFVENKNVLIIYR
jgi:putative tryptophan/tyrosine transport system substrate-binding protein